MKSSPWSGRAAGIVPGIAGMALLGSTVAVIDALAGVAVFWVQSVRYAAAALTLVALAPLFGQRLVRPNGPELLRVLAGAGLGLVGFNFAVIIGTAHAEPAVLGAAVSGIPMVLAIGGPLASGQRPSARVLAGAAVVGVGALLVSGWGRTDLTGLAMGLAMIACEAGFTIVGAPILGRIGGWTYSTLTCAAAAATFGLLGIITRPAALFDLATVPRLAAVGYLGAIGTALAFVLWFRCVRTLGAGTAGLAAGSAAPASALVGGLVGLGLPSIMAWVGMAVIAVGLVVGLSGERRRVDHRDVVPAGDRRGVGR